MSARRAVIALVTLCLGAGAAPATAQPQPDVAPEIRVQLGARQITTLSAEIAGKVVELPLREGERFTAGQRLAVFDCEAHRARLGKAVAMEDAARKTVKVNNRLDSHGSISVLDVQLAASELAAAESETRLMRDVVRRCVIEAPFSGRVGEVKAHAWQYVSEGQELMQILNDRELEVEMVMPSRWLAKLRPGALFTVVIDETGATLDAEITRLSSLIDPVSQSIKVFGRIKGAVDGLLPGMSGTFRMPPS